MSARKTAVRFAAVAALAVSFYAANVTSAAGDRAASTPRLIVNCRTNPVDVNAGVQIYASASGVTIATGDPGSPTALLSVKSKETQYRVGGACRGTKRRSPLGPGSFPSTHAPTVDCAAPAHVILRLVLRLDASGVPVSAKLEVTQGRFNFKPLGYVQWARGAAMTYYRPGTCTPKK